MLYKRKRILLRFLKHSSSIHDLEYKNTKRLSKMAVQQNKKSRSKRDMRRSHDSLTIPTLSTDKSTGELHLRHHVSPNGFYKGRKVVETKSED